MARSTYPSVWYSPALRAVVLIYITLQNAFLEYRNLIRAILDDVILPWSHMLRWMLRAYLIVVNPARLIPVPHWTMVKPCKDSACAPRTQRISGLRGAQCCCPPISG
jgi:hypothetical protein